MRSKYSIKEILFVCVMLALPALNLEFVYASLPDTVPIHFNAAGKANGFGSKKTLGYTLLFLSVVAVGLYLLLKNIALIDPKKASGTSPKILERMGMGLVFVYMGNLMYSVRPNYFVGIRSPWTLENEDNWRATHRFGSKMFFISGIVVVVGTLVCPASAAIWILEGSVAVMTIAPLLYSFLYFRKRKSE